ncbi:hypothetical protein BC936DRAFT_140625 [Jimgerdemannia flammicorona]|uniref:Uncharacterized protein n=1 Tax=Jimgerdemannia flammicorona TaxID=994334 RepID=A0A433AIT1_9FUNG|nr:hypothetical protein BC936DRAFT_140625 [Jimgerdemannia flammicorona]
MLEVERDVFQRGVGSCLYSRPASKQPRFTTCELASPPPPPPPPQYHKPLPTGVDKGNPRGSHDYLYRVHVLAKRGSKKSTGNPRRGMIPALATDTYLSRHASGRHVDPVREVS